MVWCRISEAWVSVVFKFQVLLASAVNTMKETWIEYVIRNVYLPKSPHGVTTQKNIIFVFTAVTT
jgi:hypothetical protein